MAAERSAIDVKYMEADLYKAARDADIHKLTKLSANDLSVHLTPQRNNLLHIASQFGKEVSVKGILDKLRGSSSGSFLKKTNQKGETALHLAAKEGHLEVVKVLIEKAEAGGAGEGKALMRMTNKKGETALHEAVRYNHQKVVDLLVKKDPDLPSHGANCSSPLYLAAERGYADLVEIVIGQSTSDVHAGLDRKTALHAAVIGRHIDITKKILEKKPGLINEVDAKGWSPLHYAAYLKDNIIATEILKHKSLERSVIYLGIKDGNRTALHIASLVGCKAIVKLLLKHAPDCSEQVDAHGQNVFHFAVMNNYQPKLGSELLELKELRVRGLVNEKDKNEHTPFRLLAIPSSGGGTSSGFDNDVPFTQHEMVDKMERKNKELKAEEMKKMPTLVTLSI